MELAIFMPKYQILDGQKSMLLLLPTSPDRGPDRHVKYAWYLGIGQPGVKQVLFYSEYHTKRWNQRETVLGHCKFG
jgi:hypothetical protein